MSNYWNSLLNSLHPYVPGEQPTNKDIIKLNTNENPFPPSPRVIEKIKGAVDGDLRRYPDPNAMRLKEELGNYFDLTSENVFIGNGSDEVLALCFLAFFEKSKPILFPNITYSFYKVYANMFQIPYELIPLKDDFTLCVQDYCKPNGGILIANPNAPTSIALPLEQIELLLRNNPNSVVIIDEAYVDFGAQSAKSFVLKYPNLLVIQTLSKSRSLAGLRVGFALGSHQLIQGLEIVKNSFNSYPIDRLALIGAEEAIKDEAYFQFTRNEIIRIREWTKLQLDALGFEVLPSKANFLFVRHPKLSAEKLFADLKEKDILVRYFQVPLLEEYLRITIGTEEEMNKFLTVMNQYNMTKVNNQ